MAIWTAITNLLSAPPPPPPPPPCPVVMAPGDCRVIREYAIGNPLVRAEAIRIYRHYIPLLGAQGCRDGEPFRPEMPGALEMRFMAEVDNPTPDLGLRAVYRAAVIGAVRAD